MPTKKKTAVAQKRKSPTKKSTVKEGSYLDTQDEVNTVFESGYANVPI